MAKDKEQAEPAAVSKREQLQAELAKAEAEHDANCERVRQSANRRAAILGEIESLENE